MKIFNDIGTYVFGVIALAVVLKNGNQVSGIISAASGFGSSLTGALLGGK